MANLLKISTHKELVGMQWRRDESEIFLNIFLYSFDPLIIVNVLYFQKQN